MNNFNVRKCPHCGHTFFYIDKDECPFCHKNINDTMDFINFFENIVKGKN